MQQFRFQEAFHSVASHVHCPAMARGIEKCPRICQALTIGYSKFADSIVQVVIHTVKFIRSELPLLAASRDTDIFIK